MVVNCVICDASLDVAARCYLSRRLIAPGGGFRRFVVGPLRGMSGSESGDGRDEVRKAESIVKTTKVCLFRSLCKWSHHQGPNRNCGWEKCVCDDIKINDQTLRYFLCLLLSHGAHQTHQLFPASESGPRTESFSTAPPRNRIKFWSWDLIAVLMWRI